MKTIRSSLKEKFDFYRLAVQVLFVQLSAGYGDYPKRLLHLFGCRKSACGRGTSRKKQKVISEFMFDHLGGHLKVVGAPKQCFFLVVFVVFLLLSTTDGGFLER